MQMHLLRKYKIKTTVNSLVTQNQIHPGVADERRQFSLTSEEKLLQNRYVNKEVTYFPIFFVDYFVMFFFFSPLCYIVVPFEQRMGFTIVRLK